jgi:catechol 2,3-dioxygenase-like lactoylglutathione lyase family enzyme
VRSLAAAAVAATALVASLAGCGGSSSLAPAPKGPYLAVSVDATHRLRPINRDLIGVDGPGPTGAEQAMRAIGVHWVRADVGFEDSYDGRPVYDCATGAFDPVLVDQRVAGIRAEGAIPLLIVDYSPPCLTANGSQDAPPDQGADQARWESLVEEMASHEIAEGVRYFEVWNEPDWTFFSGGLQAYLELYADTAHALEQAAGLSHIRIFVGGPALADVTAVQNMGWLEAFLGYVSAKGLPLDFISWHNYVNDPDAGPMQPGGFTVCLVEPLPAPPNPCYYNPKLNEQSISDEVTATRNALSAYPSLHPLLIVDEWNLDGEGDPRMDGPYDAAYAASVLDSVQSDGLSGMCFFNVANSPSNPDQNWGLLYQNLEPKPVYETFSYFHALGSEQVSASVVAKAKAAPNLDPNGRVGAIASVSSGRAQGKKVSVLLYDFKPFDPRADYGQHDPTPYDRAVSLLVSGLGTGPYLLIRSLTDGRHPASAVVAKAVVHPVDSEVRLNFTVPGEGVELVELVPQR